VSDVPLRDRLIAAFGTFVLRALAATWRVRWVNAHFLQEEHARGRPVIYVLWHGTLLPLLYTHRNRHVAVIISEHRDGELIARVAASLGFRLVRGSTSRGAARALLGASRELEAGFDLAVTVDGPRGPAHTVAPGALIIAQRTGIVMLPTSATASRGWHLRSWDKFLIPKPFARVTVAYDPPIRVAADTPRDATQESQSVHAGIEHARQAAEAEQGHRPG